MSTEPQAGTLAAFNVASFEAAERDLLACCASRSFARTIADGRPYLDPAALQAAVTAAFEALTWDDILESVNAHPRIGDRARSFRREYAGPATSYVRDFDDQLRSALL